MYFPAIETLVEEIEKGAEGGLRTMEGVQIAVDAIQQIKAVDEALGEARLKEAIDHAKTLAA